MTPQPANPTPANPACQQMAQRYVQVRAQTESLAAPLSEADCQVQSMPDASPTKWHLAHVTWFFETFVLERFEPGFQPFHPAFRVLFNSYYQAVGDQHPRPQRGLITRPDLNEIRAYRAQVDARVGRAQAWVRQRWRLERLQSCLHQSSPRPGQMFARLVASCPAAVGSWPLWADRLLSRRVWPRLGPQVLLQVPQRVLPSHA